jgi:acyl carrier protein
MVNASQILDILYKSRSTIRRENVKTNVALTQQGFDSVDLSMLIFHAEDAYSIKIPTSALGALNSIDDLVAYINRQSVAEKAANDA